MFVQNNQPESLKNQPKLLQEDSRKHYLFNCSPFFDKSIPLTHQISTITFQKDPAGFTTKQNHFSPTELYN